MIDPFHIALHRMIEGEIDDRMIKLAAGSAMDYADYRKRVGEIEAFQVVLNMAQQVEDTRYGSPKEVGE